MYGLFKKLVANKRCIQECVSSVEEAMAGIKREGEIEPQELNQLFQARFFNWIGQGVVQPRLERPPFQAPHVLSVPVPPYVSLQPEVPENDKW